MRRTDNDRFLQYIAGLLTNAVLIGAFLVLFGRYVVNGDLAKHSVVGRSTIWFVFGLVVCCLAVSYEEIIDTGSAFDPEARPYSAECSRALCNCFDCGRQSHRSGLATSSLMAHHNQTYFPSYREALRPSARPFLPFELLLCVHVLPHVFPAHLMTPLIVRISYPVHTQESASLCIRQLYCHSHLEWPRRFALVLVGRIRDVQDRRGLRRLPCLPSVSRVPAAL